MASDLCGSLSDQEIDKDQLWEIERCGCFGDYTPDPSKFSNRFCRMCQKVGHLSVYCPWAHQGVPPGTKVPPNVRVQCMCCYESVHYMEGVLAGRSPKGYAVLKNCAHCGHNAEHETPVCPIVVKDRLQRDADFDPAQHHSFYVEGLPTSATELDLYAHFRKANLHQLIAKVVVYPGQGLGYLTFLDCLEAARPSNGGMEKELNSADKGTQLSVPPTVSTSRPRSKLQQL